MTVEYGRSHRKLEVWQRSMQLVKAIYDLTQIFHKDATYELSSHRQRSVVHSREKWQTVHILSFTIPRGGEIK